MLGRVGAASAAAAPRGRVALLAAAALAIVVTPWTIRNERQFGRFIPLRDNLGLEMALGNYPGALAPPSLAAVDRRLDEVHPLRPGAPRAAMRAAGGETRYFDRLGAETRAWIAAHPLEFARLCARHYRQFYIPDLWAVEISEWNSFRPLRAWIIRALGLAGTAGLLWSLARRRRGYGWIALYYGSVGLVYALIQPVPRHGYLVWGLQVFLAAGFAADLRALAARRRARR